jgi:tetratricopeptide (TPR) repeat protein
VKALLVVVSALIIACSPATPPAQRATTRPALKPVALPDLSNAAESAQTQIRARYASLEAAIGKPDIPSQELASAYGDMAKLFLAAEYFDAAEACLENAHSLSPSDMQWPYYLAHVFRFKNDPTRAIGAFEQALAIKGDYVPSLVWLAEMHLALNEPQAAEAPLAKAQSLQPDSGAVLYGLGRVALAKKDYSRAVESLERALKVAPQATRIYYPLAMAYRGLGNRTQADIHLRKRGDVDVPVPDPLLAEVTGLMQNAAAYEARGSQALEAKQWAEAVSQLSKAVELAPDNAFTRLNLGTALYMRGDSDAALAQYREAVRLSPSFAQASFTMGVLLESRGQDREAIAAFSSAVMNDPANLDAQFSLANALRRTGQVKESLPHYAEILRVNPAASQASFGYAMGLVRLGRYPDARARLEAGVKAFPDQLGFAHALARLLAAAPDDRVRDGVRANALVSALLKTQRSPALAETMAMAQAELGRFDEALRWQREAIDLARQSGRTESLPQLESTLHRYEARQPCRTPWTDDDPVHHPRPES